MPLSPLKLIVGALGLVCLLPIGFGDSVAVSQRRNRNHVRQFGLVRIQPLAVRSAYGEPSVRVTVDRNVVRVGEQVRFTVTPTQLISNSGYRVTIDFGDGTRRQVTEPIVTHRYRAAGHYKFYASVVGGPAGSTQQTPVPRVTLILSPTSTTVGGEVRLTAQLSSDYPNIRYRFAFGDGQESGWQVSSLINHTYRAPGNYLPFVDIGTVGRGGIVRLGGSPRKPIQVTDASLGPVELIVNPSTARTNRLVTFNARVASTDPTIRYRFAFGDNSPIGAWQSSSQTSHTYSAAGTYSAYVEVARLSNVGLRQEGSSRRTILITAPGGDVQGPVNDQGDKKKDDGRLNAEPKSSPTPPPTATPSATPIADSSQSPGGSPQTGLSSPAPSASPGYSDSKPSLITGDLRDDWWKYLLIVLLLAYPAYRLGKWLAGPRPTIHTLPDLGTATVSDATGLSIDTNVVLRPNVLQGEHLVSSDAGVVKNVRRENV